MRPAAGFFGQPRPPQGMCRESVLAPSYRGPAIGVFPCGLEDLAWGGQNRFEDTMNSLVRKPTTLRGLGHQGPRASPGIGRISARPADREKCNQSCFDAEILKAT